ncbi:MAG: TonB-dependent receptor [Sphingomonadales bacterium]|jgi:iron complex outermembrane receptor protein|nr:TonB-dependent receptor [Sphingomonadales bacterium]MBK9002360.1 TonB-dependent receptor [Sphingomonadales bacterium]MBK9267586.1 TonB-dependent receptor [Sphingomonadales bacterium]MBP6433140.1 TonB-dependent receptor [Sphingorhabdus sp.]
MKFQSVSRAILMTGIAFGSVAAAAPVRAQDETTAETGADSGEIIVTARRREESLLDVPIAVTAYSGEALAQAGAMDITAISDTTPNVTLENSRATNSTLTAFIRGVGQQDPVGGFEAGVGIYLDDVYLNRPQAAVLDIYEVERIEVLRGPQGTLYGRNTIGGAVKYVTKQLPDEFQLKLRATLGTYKQADGVVTVSAPIGDLFRVGGSLARLSRGGFGDNLTTGRENYNKDVWAGRGTVEFGGNDAPVLIRISGDYTHDKSDPRGGHRLIGSLQSNTPVLDDVYDTRGALVTPEQDIKAYGLAMNISANLTDNLTLRSISAWREDESFAPIDFDALPAVDVDVPGYYGNEQISQEFQLLYEGDKLNGLVGFYYLDAQAITNFDVLLYTTGNLLAFPQFSSYTAGTVNTETWSVFGDFTYDFSDQFAISLGGRYTSDKRRADILKQRRILGPDPQLGGIAPIALVTDSDFEGERKFTKFTPRASVQFKPNDDHLLYASFSTGFKGGGFDPRGNSTGAPDTDRNGVRSYQEIFDFLTFDPETVKSYEIGYKGSLADGNLRLAITGFRADYNDVQIPGSVGVDNNGDGVFETFAGITTNASKARLQGVEIESFASLARDFAGNGSALSFNGTLGYIDGKYLRFINNLGVDVADFRRIQNTPKWTASGTLAVSVPGASGLFNAQTTLSYRSKTNQFETPSPYLDQKGYALLDASLVWTSDDDRFTVGIYGKNLLDKHYKTSGYQFITVDPTTGVPILSGAGNVIPALGQEGVLTAFYGNPRQVFATIGVKF